MGLIDNLRALFKNSQNTNEQYNRAVYNWLGQSVIWNSENDDTYIDKGYRQNATIYSIINLVTKTASSIPLMVYEKVRESSYQKYRSMNSGIITKESILHSKLLRKEALVELEDTELHRLLERPNPAQSFSSFLQEIIAFGMLTGNRYIYGIGPDTGVNLGKFQELYVLPSQKMEIVSGGLMQPVKEYTLQYNGEYKIPADAICHIKDFNPYFDGSGSNLYGQSPLKAGLRSLTTNNEAVQTGVKYLQNQTARGILTTQEEDGINEVQAQQLKDKFRQAHQGSSNAGDILISPKKMSWVNFGLSATDLSLIEQYNASVKDLCNIYNVPVQMLNNTDSATYNNMKEAKKALYQQCVIPQLINIRDEFNRWLAPKFGEKICIDFDFTSIPELQEETEKLVDQMAKSWWLTPNEKREAMSFGVDEEEEALNDYYIPANLMPAKGSDINLVNPTLPTERVQEEEPIEAPVFSTQEEAEAEAERLGGSGYHTHEQGGETIFMPFSTHEAYEQAVKYVKVLKHSEVSANVPKNVPADVSQPDGQAKILKQESYDTYPQGATNNAKRMIAWREKYGRDVVQGGTNVGWTRASQLSKREALSVETLARVKSFLARHKENAKIDPDYRGTPWKDKGYVAYNLWGGESMRTWVNRLFDRLDNE